MSTSFFPLPPPLTCYNTSQLRKKNKFLSWQRTKSKLETQQQKEICNCKLAFTCCPWRHVAHTLRGPRCVQLRCKSSNASSPLPAAATPPSHLPPLLCLPIYLMYLSIFLYVHSASGNRNSHAFAVIHGHSHALTHKEEERRGVEGGTTLVAIVFCRWLRLCV